MSTVKGVSMKTGVIDIGGGMRGIYAAGVFDAFIDFGIKFDYCIGVSAGTANLVSFLAGQKGRNYRFYVRHAQDKRYMSLENMIKKGEYFDKEVFLERSCKALMASCALPIACRAVKINDVEYFDGGVSDPIPIRKAIEDGCDRVVVLLPRNVNLRKKPESLRYVYLRALRKYPEIIEAINQRHEKYNRAIDELIELREQGKAVIISPAVQINARINSKNPALLDRLYKQGRRDAVKALPEIRKWGL